VSIVKRVSAVNMMPAWYGLAWKEWHSNQSICLPIGMNTIAAVVRNLYYTIRFAGYRVSENPRDAHAQGRRDGRAESRAALTENN
jgi:hypothetical protein